MLVYCNYVLTFAYSFTRMEFEGSIPSLETMFKIEQVTLKTLHNEKLDSSR